MRTGVVPVLFRGRSENGFCEVSRAVGYPIQISPQEGHTRHWRLSVTYVRQYDLFPTEDAARAEFQRRRAIRKAA
jgi:hypothetical protein